MAANQKKQEELTSQDYYWASYAHYGIHEEMLKDTVRTRSYQQAILGNEHLIRGKVVLDVGCGTGILCLFAAKVRGWHNRPISLLERLSVLRQAGASRVFGIECSAIAEQASQIVKDNGLAEQITIIHGKVEEVSLPVDKVDILISEWMGYCCLYESMLPTVLFARDKWLRPGGMLLPDLCTLSLVAVEDNDYRGQGTVTAQGDPRVQDRQEKIEFWNNVYGFDMRVIRALAMEEPLVDTVDPGQVATAPSVLATFDINTCTTSACTFKAPFALTATRNEYIHALVAYFDVHFQACHRPIVFSTSPASRPTHWKQTVFYLEDTLVVCEGETIRGELECKPNVANPRDLDIVLHYEFRGSSMCAQRTQTFKMR